ncbi:MAG: hypothetical protein ACOCVQ_00535 [Bacillota bacterium]
MTWNPERFKEEQPTAFRMLRGILDRGSASSAYLFIGSRGRGREEAARWFARGLVCRLSEGPDVPCGECDSCAMDSDTHPDIHSVERKGGKSSIGIEEVRTQVREPLGRRSFYGGRKVVIIPEAEKLTIHAQNALLKTLEDPLGASSLLLIVPGPGYMLPTVRSRCVIIPFGNPGVEAFRRRLRSEGVDAERISDIFTMSGGDLEIAREMTSPEGTTVWQSLGTLVESLMADSLSPAQISDWAEKLGGDAESAEHKLDIVAVTFRRAMTEGKVTPRQYSGIVDVLTETIEALRANANRRLALEVCLIELRDILI